MALVVFFSFRGGRWVCSERKTEDRAEMMRAVFAAQRTAEPNNSFQSEFSNVSAESPLDYLFGGPPDPGPEEFLMQLGFGGPSVGVERVPERFLKPSQLHGVDVEKYLSIQHHLAEDVETGALGYRGLSGNDQFPSLKAIICITF